MSVYVSSYNVLTRHFVLFVHSKPSAVSFAEDRVYETAQSFIKKYPHAQLLVTADIHQGKTCFSVRLSLSLSILFSLFLSLY